MVHNPIQITQDDFEIIHKLLRDLRYSGHRSSPYIQKLKEELERAEVISPQNASMDLITMDATAVLFDKDTGEQFELKLVMPENSDLSQGKISILAPIGAAMLGYRQGDTFEWETPGGKRTIRVEKVFPPAGETEDLPSFTRG